MDEQLYGRLGELRTVVKQLLRNRGEPITDATPGAVRLVWLIAEHLSQDLEEGGELWHVAQSLANASGQPTSPPDVAENGAQSDELRRRISHKFASGIILMIKTSLPSASDAVKSRAWVRCALNGKCLLACLELMAHQHEYMLAMYTPKALLCNKGGQRWDDFVQVIAPIAGPPLEIREIAGAPVASVVSFAFDFTTLEDETAGQQQERHGTRECEGSAVGGGDDSGENFQKGRQSDVAASPGMSGASREVATTRAEEYSSVAALTASPAPVASLDSRGDSGGSSAIAADPSSITTTSAGGKRRVKTTRKVIVRKLVRKGNVGDADEVASNRSGTTAASADQLVAGEENDASDVDSLAATVSERGDGSPTASPILVVGTTIISGGTSTGAPRAPERSRAGTTVAVRKSPWTPTAAAAAGTQAEMARDSPAPRHLEPTPTSTSTQQLMDPVVATTTAATTADSGAGRRIKSRSGTGTQRLVAELEHNRAALHKMQAEVKESALGHVELPADAPKLVGTKQTVSAVDAALDTYERLLQQLQGAIECAGSA